MRLQYEGVGQVWILYHIIRGGLALLIVFFLPNYDELFAQWLYKLIAVLSTYQLNLSTDCSISQRWLSRLQQ